MTQFVLVADAARARLIAADPKLERFEEREVLTHDDSRRPNRDLRSDQPGNMQAFPGGPASALEEEGHHRHEAEVFARQVVDRLNELVKEGKLDTLVLVAPPRFLGMLRPLLPARVEVREIPNDLTNLPVHEVMARVRQA